MNNLIEVPLWLLVVLTALAVVTSLQYFLLPPVRMLLRRRANRLIDEVNSRLALELPSFKLTKREVLIDRLVYHPHVMAEVDRVAREEGTSRDAIVQQVRSYAVEIVPAFNARLYFKWAYWLARRIVHMLYRVRLGFADDASLKDLPPNSSVVFVMNHRSNMDYIVATYLAAERTALSYAVGEWARTWPLQQLIRMMGGYFVRRDSGDGLYRQVLQCYVQMAAEGGVPQAVFPEGYLSRDGKLSAPKLGLLGYLARPYLQADREFAQQLPDTNDSPGPVPRDSEPESKQQSKQALNSLVFIPVGINYDRVLEDRILLANLRNSQSNTKPKFKFFTLGRFARFLGKQAWLALTGRWYRFGYACVNFGTPLSLCDWIEQRKATGIEDNSWHDQVEALSQDLMERIGDIIPILPVALVATVFRNAKQYDQSAIKLSEIDIKRRVTVLIDHLVAGGAHVYIPRNNLDYAVTVGLRMLELRHLLINDDGWYALAPENEDVLDFYASSIEHFDTVIQPSETTGNSDISASASTSSKTGNTLEQTAANAKHQSSTIEPTH